MPDKCPVCGMPVRIVRRANGAADHYEPELVFSGDLPVLDEATAVKLRELRKDKKTVAFVGTAMTSCSLAPYDESDVEIWAVNEEHAYAWMKRATRWFQIHKKEMWHEHNTKWIQENPWHIPVYTQFVRPDIPFSIEYPLADMVERFFKNMRRGDSKIKYFTSTFAYMMALAISEGFERIEIYGFEMSDDTEYIKQKACAEFWLGKAGDIEIYFPPDCQILNGELYGYV
jgi:hypothetical protein